MNRTEAAAAVPAMKRAALALGVLGCLILLGVGCNSLDLAITNADGAANVRIIDGSPSVVALSIKETLGATGFEAVITPGSDTLVVESKNALGQKFGVMLKSVQGKDGKEQTHMSLVWLDNKGDDKTGIKVMAAIDQRTPAKK